MKAIRLDKGMQTVVDDEDFGWASEHRWVAVEGRLGCFYAARNNGRRSLQMHREIMLREKDLGRDDLVDHRNHDTLDNRRHNLRVVGYSVSNIHRRLFRNNSTGFRGVHRCNTTDRFIARVKLHGRYHVAGTYTDPQVAARAYNTLALQLHGDEAVLNTMPLGVDPFLDIEAHRQSNRAGRNGKFKTHCLRGHPFEGDNLIVEAGRRICRACATIRKQAYYRRRKSSEGDQMDV